MISASGSFDDFMEQFKKRHPKEYGLDSGRSVAVKVPMAKVYVKATEKPVSVPNIKGLEYEFNAPEVVEMMVDRKSAAAGDDWADVWDDSSGEAEVLD
jgi:hypothetical protein